MRRRTRESGASTVAVIAVVTAVDVVDVVAAVAAVVAVVAVVVAVFVAVVVYVFGHCQCASAEPRTSFSRHGRPRVGFEKKINKNEKEGHFSNG